MGFSLFGAFGGDPTAGCGGPDLLQGGGGDDEVLAANLRRLEMSSPLGSPEAQAQAQAQAPTPWTGGNADQAQSLPGHKRSNSDPPAANVNYNIWGSCSGSVGSRVWAHDVGSPSKSWAGPVASGAVAAAPPDPDEALAHLRFAAAADATPCCGSGRAQADGSSGGGPVVSAGRMDLIHGGSAMAAPRPASCGDATSRPPSGGTSKPPSNRPPSGSTLESSCAD